jgi:hypothetical protein
MCSKRKKIIVDKLWAVNHVLVFLPADKKTKPTYERLACFAHTLTPPTLDKLLFYVDNL